MLCIGYWAAHYINRDGDWSVACDALGRVIRCETKKLALSVARYRRCRLRPLQGGSSDFARIKKQYGRDGVGRGLLFRGDFEMVTLAAAMDPRRRRHTRTMEAEPWI
jgi:hypothetical protein